MSVGTTLPRIKRLPDSVASQIAAGEVIERPASVLKELIENSIDAAATQLHIDIEQAGMGLIRIRDNGQGIHKNDLALALQAHATSKLSLLSDLSQIVSLGFRGEAIPSIASVSRFSLTSRTADAGQAWSIDNTMLLKPAAQGTGTTVEVQDLFHSTPGRRKFLKSEKTEYLHIQSLLRAFALSQFNIAFNVTHNQQSVFNLPACSGRYDQRVLRLCGKTFMHNCITIDTEDDELRLWGWCGLSDSARSQTDRQYFYVNGRYIRDKHVNHALRLAYADLIAPGRFPSYVLHLELDPANVDVNVHPAKHEVRFANSRNVHDFIYTSLMQGLNEPQSSLVNNRLIQPETIQAEAMPSKIQASDRSSAVPLQVSIPDQLPATAYTVLEDGRYLIARIDQAQYLIDVFKTNVFLSQNYFLENVNTDSITRRPVLVPLACELTAQQIDLLAYQSAQIKRWGIELEIISPTQVSIRALPARLVFANATALILDFMTAIKKRVSDRVMAETLASHVNDAGWEPDQASVKRLIKEVHAYSSEVSNHQKSPWRKLDAHSLKTLLQN